MSPTCPYCNNGTELVSGEKIYPHRPDLFSKKFWSCAPCGAYVGCHPPAVIARGGKEHGGIGDGTVPMGRLANAELRREKQAAHAAFDRLWKSGAMSRRDAYAWLASKLGIEKDACHIGMFNEAQCRAVVAVCREKEGFAEQDKLAMCLRPGDVFEYMGRHVRVLKISSQLRSKSRWIDGEVVQGDPLPGKGSILCQATQIVRVVASPSIAAQTVGQTNA